MAKKTKQSLIDFMKAKKRRACPVCSLPEGIRSELLGARDKKIKRSEALEWLAAEWGIKIPASIFDTHNSARHDQ